MQNPAPLLLSATLVLSAAASGAAMAAPAESTASTATTTGAALAAGDVYLPSSRVWVRVGKTGFGHEHGVAGALRSGRVTLGAAENAGELVFEMAKFAADTDAARKQVGLAGGTSASTSEQVTANMLGPEVLDAKRHPTAVFRIDSALPAGGAGAPGRYVLRGELTLVDHAGPLSIDVEVSEQNGWNRVRGSFRMNQTDFGIKPYSKALGAVGVADELTIWGDLWVAPTAGSAPGRGASGG